MCLAACDRVFQLGEVVTEVDAYEPPCSPVGHDEDGDGRDDACDPCPFAATNEPDTDRDGIADACDAAPAVPNTRLLFDGFGSPNPSLVATGGTVTGDAFVPSVSDSNGLLYDAMADEVWILAGVDVASLEETTYREVGVLFDATLGANEPDGTYCVLGRANTQDYTQIYIRARPAGDAPLTTQEAQLPLAELRDGILRGHHARVAPEETTCAFTVGTRQSSIAGVRAPAPPRGRVGLYASHVEASFSFVFVTGR